MRVNCERHGGQRHLLVEYENKVDEDSLSPLLQSPTQVLIFSNHENHQTRTIKDDKFHFKYIKSSEYWD